MSDDEVKSIIGSLGDLSKTDKDESTEIKSNEDDKTATRRHDHFISMAHKRKMDDYNKCSELGFVQGKNQSQKSLIHSLILMENGFVDMFKNEI